MFVTGGTNMQPAVHQGDFLMVSNWEQEGIMFHDIKVGDIIVASGGVEDDYGVRLFVSRVTAVIDDHYQVNNQTFTRKLLITQGDNDNTPVPTQDRHDWIGQKDVVHETEFFGKVLDVVSNQQHVNSSHTIKHNTDHNNDNTTTATTVNKIKNIGE